MEQFGILISLIGLMFGTIIGVYCWVYKVSDETTKSIAEILKVVNKHFQCQEIHADARGFVPISLCKALHDSTKEKVDEIGAKQSKVISELSEVKGDVKAILLKVSEV